MTGLLDETSRHQRAHDTVDVHAAHRRDPRTRHRLPVGHDGKRLQGGRREAPLDGPLEDREALAGNLRGGQRQGSGQSE